MAERERAFRPFRLEGLERLWIAFAAVMLALFLGAGFILWAGKSPLVGYQALWQGSFGSLQNFAELTVSMTPLVFTGLSIAVAYRAGLFNIGAEGQFIVGQIAGAWAGAASVFTGWPMWAHLPVTLLAGFLAGGLWAAVPGLLKAYRGVHEVINTIMMNWIALYFTHWLVMGPLRADPIVPRTKDILPSAMLWRFLLPSRANLGIVVALLVALAVWYLMWKTTVGYGIRAVGYNPSAAEYAGIPVARHLLLAMIISGGLAGLGGAVWVSGVQLKFLDIFTFTGYGFDGIAVALLGNNHPLGVVGGAFLFGIFARGAQLMQSVADIPKEIISVVTAVVIILVAADQIIRGLGRRRSSRRAKEVAAHV
ncbi:MAG: ABC transporter permease [Bacillota bacterium]|nr:ABC transporter permease [Bacillota bacterium]